MEIIQTALLTLLVCSILYGTSLVIIRREYIRRLNRFVPIGTLTLAECQNEVYKWALEKGWCEREVPLMEQCMLVVTELAEAIEAYRNHEATSWTDANGKPQGIASEYADALIRLLHYSALMNINLEKEYQRKMVYNGTRPYRHGGKLA